MKTDCQIMETALSLAIRSYTRAKRLGCEHIAATLRDQITLLSIARIRRAQAENRLFVALNPPRIYGTTTRPINVRLIA